MRLPWALVLGGLLAVARADRHFVRQNDFTFAVGTPDVTNTQATASASSESQPPSSQSSSRASSGSSSSSSSAGGGGGGGDTDTTVTSTTTVSGDGPSTITKFRTITSTVVVTSTSFSTSVVTEDGETATSTIFETSTSVVNQKRSLDSGLAPRTALGPASVEAKTTLVPAPTQAVYGGALFKRATITETVTVTAGGGDAPVTTTVDKVTSVFSTSVTDVVVTQTSQANAQTTVTVTSTLVVTSTSVATGVDETPPAGNDDGSSRAGRGGSGGRLSVGAKTGIGVGVGVGGLALVAAAAIFCLRRRQRPKPFDDDLIGASEVPVGGPGPVRPMAAMSEPPPALAGGYLGPAGHGHQKTESRPEGYRGTAIGDGRAGFAHPAPYGAAYAVPARTATGKSSARADVLPQHPTPESSTSGRPATAEEAAEMDGQPAMSHPGGPVYEMPTRDYW